MILPTVLIADLLNILETNKDVIANKRITFSESGEDKDKNLIEPYVAIYSDFDSIAEFTESKYPTNVPVSIYAICKSSSFETVQESFNEALHMAVKTARLLIGSYTVKNFDNKDETVNLVCQDIPLVILGKTAKGSTVQLQLQYFIKDLLG